MLSYRPGLSLVATRPLLQQTNIYLSVSSFGLLLLFAKNLTSLRSFRFSRALLKYARVRGNPSGSASKKSHPQRVLFFCQVEGMRNLKWAQRDPEILFCFTGTPFYAVVNPTRYNIICLFLYSERSSKPCDLSLRVRRYGRLAVRKK